MLKNNQADTSRPIRPKPTSIAISSPSTTRVFLGKPSPSSCQELLTGGDKSRTHAGKEARIIKDSTMIGKISGPL